MSFYRQNARRAYINQYLGYSGDFQVLDLAGHGTDAGEIWHGGICLHLTPPIQISPHQYRDGGVDPKAVNTGIKKCKNIYVPRGCMPCMIFMKFSAFVAVPCSNKDLKLGDS